MVDLRGFTFDGDSLCQLATNNCASLQTVILPAGVDAACLAALLVPLQRRLQLSVAAADLPGLKGALPQGLWELNVRGKIPRHTCTQTKYIALYNILHSLHWRTVWSIHRQNGIDNAERSVYHFQPVCFYSVPNGTKCVHCCIKPAEECLHSF